MKKKDLYFFGSSGIGDDIMLVWAYLAAVLAGLTEPGKSFYFSNPVSAAFNRYLSTEFTEIKLVQALSRDYRVITCRGIGLKKFKRGPGSLDFWYIFLSKLPIRFTGYHREASIYKGYTKFTKLIGLFRKWRLFYAWDSGFPSIYTGWQELCVSQCQPKPVCEKNALKLSSAYGQLRERASHLVCGVETNEDILLFPASASPQNFENEFVELLKTSLGVKIARFTKDPNPADIYYPDLKSAALIMAGARGVITNDSSASHVAQFFAKKHLVICSRARPGNVVFPGAVTQILDLGDYLTCRPCHYAHGEGIHCAAGYRICKAFHEVDGQTINQIKKILCQW